MKRRFSGSERVRLYLAADGSCQECGATLGPDWHADHIQPYARGGETALSNGQALCPACNLSKGARMDREKRLRPWPAERKLRTWQMEAAGGYLQHADRDYLIVATPGAGKTILALYLAHAALEEGRVERVVIVVPTEHLKYQWQKAATSIGLDLQASFSNSTAAESEDYHGVIVTYQQVAAADYLHRRHCARRPTFVIFDEIHHAGESYAWGGALQTAFEGAVRRLAMSGTPFRSDKTPIPFVRYVDGASQAAAPYGYSYGYGRAMRDEVCRPVFFPLIEGRVEWYRNGEVRSHTFDEALSETASSERLRAALDPRCEWIASTLKEADQQLRAIRSGEHGRAGGLVIAIDQDHAEAIARILEMQTGEAPCIAISKDPQASKRIEEFAEGGSAWIVAVRMVSEGVDIPRLRVVVYATNIQTEMYFRQAVGRVVRVIEGLEEQAAYFYLPADPVLMEFARAIKEERQHEVEDFLKEIIAEQEREAQSALPFDSALSRPPSDFSPIAAVGFPGDVIFEKDHYSQQELLEAERVAREAGIPGHVPALYFAQFRRQCEKSFGVPAPTVSPEALQNSNHAPGIGLEARKKGMGREVNEKVNRLAFMLVARDGGTVQDWIKHIRYRLNSGQGIISQGQATEAQLKERLQVLDGWLKNGGED